MTHDPAHGETPAGSSGRTTSRRRFLGLAAATAAIPIAGCTSDRSSSAAKKAAAKRPSPKVPVAENSLPGDPNWGISNQGAWDAMMGYAGQASVLPGQPITLYASTTAPSFVVKAFRIGWYNGDKARLLWTSPSTPGHVQPLPAVMGGTNTVECDWEPSLTIPTDNWPEGSYLLRMDAETGPQRYVPITVRSASTGGKVVIKNSTETWQAYNTWGGYNLYNGPAGSSDYNNRALAVSLDRPYDQSGAYYFLWHEQKLISVAEQLGLPLAYTTSMDIATSPGLLTGASALFCLGHDEYWTPEERTYVTAARDAGVNVAFLGANTCFRRTRLDSTRLGANRLILCYKTSYTRDPMYGKNNALVTSDYREPPNPDPESPLMPPTWSPPRIPGSMPVPARRRAPASPGWSASNTTGSTPSTPCRVRSRCCRTRRSHAAASTATPTRPTTPPAAAPGCSRPGPCAGFSPWATPTSSG
jgi:hypothetical protein